MYEHKLDRQLHCGVVVTMEILGGKWKPCLVHNIHQGLRRPSELHRQNASATPRVLNQQLKELEDDGVIYKVIYPILPPKVEYFLTPTGESLLALIEGMRAWGDEHGEAYRALVAGRARVNQEAERPD